MSEANEMLSEASGKGAGCLSSEQLDAVFAGNAPEAARRHAALCPHCHSELALLKEFVEGAPVSSEEAEAVRGIEQRLRSAPAWRPAAGVQQSGGWFSWLFSRPAMGLAAAALVALLAVGVWFIESSRPGTQPGLDPGVLRATGVQGIEPAGDLDRVPSLLRWQPVANASGYEVALLDIEEKVIWASPRQTANELHVPAEAQALMTSRKTLFWRVTAFDSRGQSLGAGAPQRFRVVLPGGPAAQ